MKHLILFLTLFLFTASLSFGNDTLKYETTPEKVTVKDTLEANRGTGITIPGATIPTALPALTITDYALWENILYHVLLIVLTYLSRFFPGIKLARVPIRTIAIALLLLIGFISARFIFAEPVKVVTILTFMINYLVTTLSYDKIYKEITGKTKVKELEPALDSNNAFTNEQ